jgi:hypothetical protein
MDRRPYPFALLLCAKEAKSEGIVIHALGSIIQTCRLLEPSQIESYHYMIT